MTRTRPAPLLAYRIDLCEHEGEPDFELIKLDPGEDAHGAMVPRDEVAALLAYIATDPHAQRAAQVALEELMGPGGEG